MLTRKNDLDSTMGHFKDMHTALDFLILLTRTTVLCLLGPSQALYLPVWSLQLLP